MLWQGFINRSTKSFWVDSQRRSQKLHPPRRKALGLGSEVCHGHQQDIVPFPTHSTTSGTGARNKMRSFKPSPKELLRFIRKKEAAKDRKFGNPSTKCSSKVRISLPNMVWPPRTVSSTGPGVSLLSFLTSSHACLGYVAHERPSAVVSLMMGIHRRSATKSHSYSGQLLLVFPRNDLTFPLVASHFQWLMIRWLMLVHSMVGFHDAPGRLLLLLPGLVVCRLLGMGPMMFWFWIVVDVCGCYE